MIPVTAIRIFITFLFLCLLLPPEVKSVKEITEHFQRTRRLSFDSNDKSSEESRESNEKISYGSRESTNQGRQYERRPANEGMSRSGDRVRWDDKLDSNSGSGSNDRFSNDKSQFNSDRRQNDGRFSNGRTPPNERRPSNERGQSNGDRRQNNREESTNDRWSNDRSQSDNARPSSERGPNENDRRQSDRRVSNNDRRLNERPQSDEKGRKETNERPQSHSGSQNRADDPDWSYSGENGPEYWSMDYPACGGFQQSPVAISSAQKNSSLGAFTFTGYNNRLTNLKLQNNGHTAQLSGPPNEIIGITGGGLDGSYRFSQLHFHWGSTSSKGSEHTINGERYPLEMHLVHTKGESEIAVLTVMFKVSRRINSNIDPIIRSLKKVEYKDTETTVRGPIKLYSLLPQNLEQYYRYTGSLTTPPCTEGVIWTIFNDFVGISESQMEAFRGLKSTRRGDSNPKALVNNFRPLQDLNGRTISEARPDC